MEEHPNRRGRKRKYDAEKTRAAILSAAESSFAMHGYNGVSVDSIAHIAACNKSLIFQYFQNKKGLYSAILTAADLKMADLVGHWVERALEDESTVVERPKFRSFLISMFGAFFDFMVENPTFARIMAWEQSDSWRTLGSITSRFEPRDLRKLDKLFSKARAAGNLRKDIDSIVLIIVVLQTCWATVVSLPFYGPLIDATDESKALKSIRRQVLGFLVSGAMKSELEAADAT